MNKQRISDYIKFLRDANVCMKGFQVDPGAAMPKSIAKTKAELHSCGNQACALGYLALMPSFLKSGGVQDIDGSAMIGGRGSASTFREWFDIDFNVAFAIVFGTSEDAFYQYTDGRKWADWTTDDLIRVMAAIRDGELTEIGEIQ